MVAQTIVYFEIGTYLWHECLAPRLDVHVQWEDITVAEYVRAMKESPDKYYAARIPLQVRVLLSVVQPQCSNAQTPSAPPWVRLDHWKWRKILLVHWKWKKDSDTRPIIAVVSL